MPGGLFVSRWWDLLDRLVATNFVFKREIVEAWLAGQERSEMCRL